MGIGIGVENMVLLLSATDPLAIHIFSVGHTVSIHFLVVNFRTHLGNIHSYSSNQSDGNHDLKSNLARPSMTDVLRHVRQRSAEVVTLEGFCFFPEIDGKSVLLMKIFLSREKEVNHAFFRLLSQNEDVYYLVQNPAKKATAHWPGPSFEVFSR